MMNKELKLKSRQVKKMAKVFKKSQRVLKDTTDKVDNLEMENYVMKEQLGEFAGGYEEVKAIIDNLLNMLESDKLDAKTALNIKNTIKQLLQKMAVLKAKATTGYIAEDPLMSKGASFSRRQTKIFNALEIGLDGNMDNKKGFEIGVDNLDGDDSDSLNGDQENCSNGGRSRRNRKLKRNNGTFE